MTRALAGPRIGPPELLPVSRLLFQVQRRSSRNRRAVSQAASRDICPIFLSASINHLLPFPCIMIGMPDVTRILEQIQHGDPHAAEHLLPLVYDELRRLAAQKMAHEKPGQTLQPTALVHEAYLRLLPNKDGSNPADDHWNSRGHFFAAAAEAMRRILIENARRKKADKHGGGKRRLSLDQAVELVDASAEDLLALDEALERLLQHDSKAAQLVKLHCFAGLSVEQAAEALDLSRTNAYRVWTFARAWLHSQLTMRGDAAP